MAITYIADGCGALQQVSTTDDSRVRVFDSYNQATSCIACLAEGEIVATKSGNPLDMDAVECMIDDKISCAGTYACGEHLTCETWIDGCPIYRYICPPTIDGNASTWTCIASIPNICSIVDARLIYNPSTGYGMRSVGAEQCNGSCVRIYSTAGWLSTNALVLLGYTKGE